MPIDPLKYLPTTPVKDEGTLVSSKPLSIDFVGSGVSVASSNDAVTVTIPGVGIGGGLLAANNLSDVVSAATSRTNLGLQIGVDVQAYSANTAFRTDKLSVFAPTTSAELAGVISDETGTGALVFGTAPVFTTSVNINGANDILTLTSPGTTDRTTIILETNGDDWEIGARGSATPQHPNSFYIFNKTDNSYRLVISDTGTIAIGTGLVTPNANAILDLVSTTKAFMPPRQTTTQRDAVASPTAGMMIYNSTTDVLNVYGSAWGAVAMVANKLSVFAATTSAELAGVISDETGSGALVFATSPVLVTPSLGIASATSINKIMITAPATGSTLTIDDGFTLHVTGNVTALSGSHTGTNTGDQTSVTGNAGTATALLNARTIGGVSFNGTANITVATATGGFTVSGGVLALGANDLTMTGSLGATGARLTKGWFTDLQVTNAMAGSITGNAATVTGFNPTAGKTLSVVKTMSFSAADDTGVYTLPTGTKTLLATDGAGTALTGIPYALTGTANQVVLSAATGNITFSLPQSIATSSTPQFGRLGLGVSAHSTVPLQISKVSTALTDEQIRINRATASSDSQSINFAGGASVDFLFGRLANSDDLVFGTNGGGGFTERFRMTTAPSFKIGGTANRGTTEGSNQLVIFNGTAPAGTLTNGVSLYSASGELRSMDSAGNSTLLSPHDHKTNEWIFHSKNTVTGKVLQIDMERMMKALNVKLGGGFVREYIEAI